MFRDRAAGPHLLALHVGRGADMLLGMEDQARSVGVHADQLRTRIIVPGGEEFPVRALQRNRRRDSAVAEKRHFGEQVGGEAFRRIAVDAEAGVDLAGAHGVQIGARMPDSLGQAAELHVALRRLLDRVHPRNVEVDVDRMGPRNPRCIGQGRGGRGRRSGQGDRRHRAGGKQTSLHRYPSQKKTRRASTAHRPGE